MSHYQLWLTTVLFCCHPDCIREHYSMNLPRSNWWCCLHQCMSIDKPYFVSINVGLLFHIFAFSTSFIKLMHMNIQDYSLVFLTAIRMLKNTSISNLLSYISLSSFYIFTISHLPILREVTICYQLHVLNLKKY